VPGVKMCELAKKVTMAVTEQLLVDNVTRIISKLYRQNGYIWIHMY